MHSTLRSSEIFLLLLLAVGCAQSISDNLGLTSASTPISSESPVSATASATRSSATATITTGSGFPSAGSVAREYTPEGLEKLWNIVGPVEPPPFTTTRIPTAPVALPSSPPPLYPSFFAPEPKDILPDLNFPVGFLFGVATAAYQVEGAAKDEGKGPTMWDWATRQPNAIADNSTGDISGLQYYLYKEDVERVAALGVTAHSFSISWARIFPFGTSDSPVNSAGIDHYADVIDYHLAHGVQPVVTLFHWDAPLALQAYYGGFTNAEIVDDFINYAKTVFQAYNGSVTTWYTFNEPRVYCGQIASYPFNISNYAQGINASTAPFQCAYNTLKAHAGAVKVFREMGITGEIALKNDDFIGRPWRTNSTEDALAVERHAAFQIGIFSDPLYTSGDWPNILKDTLSPEYLPRFTEKESADLLGSADFYAIDSYRSQFIRAPLEGLDACLANISHPLWPGCNEPVAYDSESEWPIGWYPDPAATWLQATPLELRAFLRDLKERWPSKKLYISEFGFVEAFENNLTDMHRVKMDVARTSYFMTYLGEILLAIHEDGIPVAGAFAWAMLDNAEWSSGYSARFGIQYTNYTTLERTYKRSALSLSEFFANH